LTEFDLQALFRALHDHDISFVVIGGVAVGAHGFVRGTEDLDLVPEPDRDNLRRLNVLLAKLEATLPTAEGRSFDPATDGAVIRRGGNVTANTKFGALDIVQRARGVPGYARLAEDAVDSDLLGVPVKICSLGRLREMKRAQSRAQDLLDLENLPEED
jgi:hypothetical protein